VFAILALGLSSIELLGLLVLVLGLVWLFF